MSKSLLAAAIVFAFATTAANAGENVFQDAVAVWNFSGTENGTQTYPLSIHGAVTPGKPLEGDERTASLARGGDGKAAVFNGGYLEIGGPAFDPPGAEFTLLLRVRDPQGEWKAPLFGSYGGDGAASLYLRGMDGATLPLRERVGAGGEIPTTAGAMFGWPDGPRAIKGSHGVIEFIWGATAFHPSPARKLVLPKSLPNEADPPLLNEVKNSIMRIMFPVEPLGPREWHDVVVRCTGPKLQLWIDGVLLDEEFPIGTTRPASAPRYFGAAQLADGTLLSGFHGMMDHAALWHRALDEKEIAKISGGAEWAKQRELAVLGAPPERMQYFRPFGYNTISGDSIPIFHDGTYHLFYLVLRRNMHSKWMGGHGGLEIHHASTRDLVHWKHHPIAIPITEQWEAWNGTGGIVHHDGRFWMFYPAPNYESEEYGGIQLATSEDGEHFTKQQPHPFLPGGDCDVFHDPDPEKKLFHLIKQGKTSPDALPELKDKTLVAWVSPADTDQHGAGVLTVDDGKRFDSLVLGECAPRRWMAGSENLVRTQKNQNGNMEETAKPGEWVQIAAVYEGDTVTLYRNGVPYTNYRTGTTPEIAAGGRVILGLRHFAVRNLPAAHFRGGIADARVYNKALSAAEIAELRPHEADGPKPLVWYDFKTGSTTDRAGTLPTARLEGNASLQDDKLLLAGNTGFLVSSGPQVALSHFISEDLGNWRELPEPFLVADAMTRPQMCPQWFQWNGWYYCVGGVDGLWKSRQPFGPWTQQSPRQLDALFVPKVAEFTGNRRILAGFFGDVGWGNIIMRELVQDADGTLGTRFVPEMIPPGTPPVALKLPANPTRLEAEQERQQILIDQIPNDVRLTLTLVPEGPVKAFGLRLRTTDGKSDGTGLRFEPGAATAGFSARTSSGGPNGKGPTIEGLEKTGRAMTLDIVCTHDLVDVEINGRHTLINRYWNPKGDRLGIWVEGGTLSVKDATIRNLLEHTPPGALRAPEMPQAGLPKNTP